MPMSASCCTLAATVSGVPAMVSFMSPPLAYSSGRDCADADFIAGPSVGPCRFT